ncbi:unnamed protein product [Mytilus coruscus]|uniref:Uncharacterized protein n=1 Tax=Mytilus coruscus TaxID=42192 RepID=A0A6J8BSJ5_MYTCO|nr:unnamed protein product [Mytilus coruscus]
MSSSKRDKPKWQTLDNFFTKTLTNSTNSDSHAETQSASNQDNIDSETSNIDAEISLSATLQSMSKPVQKNLGPSYPDISLLKDSTSLGKDVKLQLLTDKWKDVHTFKFPTSSSHNQCIAGVNLHLPNAEIIKYPPPPGGQYPPPPGGQYPPPPGGQYPPPPGAHYPPPGGAQYNPPPQGPPPPYNGGYGPPPVHHQQQQQQVVVVQQNRDYVTVKEDKGCMPDTDKWKWWNWLLCVLAVIFLGPIILVLGTRCRAMYSNVYMYYIKALYSVD